MGRLEQIPVVDDYAIFPYQEAGADFPVVFYFDVGPLVYPAPLIATATYRGAVPIFHGTTVAFVCGEHAISYDMVTN